MAKSFVKLANSLFFPCAEATFQKAVCHFQYKEIRVARQERTPFG
jgi:hypothetical protein